MEKEMKKIIIPLSFAFVAYMFVMNVVENTLTTISTNEVEKIQQKNSFELNNEENNQIIIKEYN